MENYWNILEQSLVRATQAMDRQSFGLERSGHDIAILRERVYCYELYHRLRLCLPDGEEFPFVLHGEVDKRGHHLLESLVGPRNPDFIVHKPGVQGDEANLAVVEVKSGRNVGTGLEKDAKTLVAFVERADYFRGVHLVFGGNHDVVRARIREAYSDVAQREQLAVFWHPEAGRAAQRLGDW